MTSTASPWTELEAAALAKMSSVLGPERSERLLIRFIQQSGARLRTPEDLARFAKELASSGSFEAAVGAMLGVEATLRALRCKSA